MAATLGVATVAYAPFTFFNFLNPLISIVYAFLGFRMLQVAPAGKASTA
jgi:NhaC family Na+:H+ antiporter